MRFEHANLIGPDFNMKKDMTVVVENERITGIGEEILSVPADEDTYDLSGLTLFPGFIDIHIHGAANADTSDANVRGFETISSYLASRAVTSFCPTTMMISKDDLKHVLMAAEVFQEQQPLGARMIGIRMEGPFLSKEKCGVQNTVFAELPSVEYMETLLSGFPDNLVTIVDLSPELPGADEFIAQMKGKVILSIAHTAATYSQTKAAIDAGVHHATHLFNAMSPLSHHEPGAVGALLTDERATCELICDGMHVHPSVLSIAWKNLGEDRAVIVSDAMRAAGMPDGEYSLGGKTVYVKNGRTDMGNGNLAGSTTDLLSEFKNLLSWGMPLRTALKACTINPAKVLGIADQVGTLEPGKYADIVAFDNEFNVKKVWVRGRLVFDASSEPQA